MHRHIIINGECRICGLRLKDEIAKDVFKLNLNGSEKE